MQDGIYDYISNKEHLDYEFYSVGPKGKIKKIVRFTMIESNGLQFYNLGFGDWNEETEAINDFAVTNNADIEKVLGTVAAIVVEFTRQFEDAIIYAEGSTLARTRRYQMGINKLWNEIYLYYDIYGVTMEEIIEPFRKNVNYAAFWLRRK